MALSDIQTKIKALGTEAAAIAAKADLTDADLTRLEEIAAQGAGYQKQIDALKRAGDFGAWANQSAGMPISMAPAGAVNVSARTEGRKSVLVAEDGTPLINAKLYELLCSTEYKSAYRGFLKNGLAGMRGDALKVLQEGLDDEGGVFVPDDAQTRIIAKEPAPTNLSGRVTSITTSRDAISFPRVVWTTDDIYTQGMRVTWTGEIPATATGHRVTQPAFGSVRIPVYTAMMSLLMSKDFLEDSSADIMGYVTGKFAETIQLLKDNMIINGTGIGQPSGILINSNFIANNVHSGSAGAYTWDGLLNCAFALHEQYDRNAVWVMNKTSSALALSKLVDGDGRPYWSLGNSGLVDQSINRPILGYPVLFNSFMPDVASAAYAAIFGDLGGYFMVNRIGFSISVDPNIYAETNQTLLLGRIRFGGQLVEDWRLVGHILSA
jgi:HK97 family phage major capsid protein